MIRLEEFTSQDFDELISWNNSKEELIQFAGQIFTFPLTKEQLHKYIDEPGVNAYKVLYNNCNIPIGHGEINLSGSNPRLCRIILNPKYRGKGLGQLIIRELLKVAFNKYAADRVELNVFDWNLSAIKCYEKVGFKVNQGVQKEILVDGKTWVTINMFIDRNTFIAVTSGNRN